MVDKVYFVGAGPGSNDLITVRGLEVLRQAEVIIYDYLIDKQLLAETKEGAELICCDELCKKRHSDNFLIHQEKINRLIVQKAKQGRKVVRLKNGDVSIFSRLSQEAGVLAKNKIEFEFIPGVSAASAAASFSGVPLTDRRFSSGVVFLTGHEAEGKLKSAINYKAIAGIDTIVLYMAVENISKIAHRLIKAGKPGDTPVIAVSNAGQISQRIATAKLSDIAKIVRKECIRPPAIFIIGKVAGLENKFNWFRNNKRVLFTGLSKKRFFIKGTYFHLPLIKIIAAKDYRRFDNYLRDIRRFDWVIFTSRFGVEYFFKRLTAIGFDARSLWGIKIAAIGSSTAQRLSDFSLRAELVAKNESAKGLIEEFKKIDIQNKKIFLPHSDLSDKGLTKGLKKLGATVTAAIAYRNVFPDNLPDLDLESFDEIMFTSPSGVRNFIKRYKRLPPGIKVRCIGEVTKTEAKKWRLI